MKKFILEFMDYLPFLKEIIKRDFKKKYYRSVLGVAWSMLSPLLMMIVVSIGFSTLFSRSIQYYPAYWFSGNMIFNFTFEGSNHAMNSITSNSSLIRKIKIPKYFFCISTVTQQFITMCMSLIPFLGVSIVIGVPFTPYMLLAPVPMLMAYFFALGLGLFLCSYATFLRDLSYIYKIVRRVLLYVTPVFYPISIVPESFRFLWYLNPICIYLTIFRNLAMDGIMPSEKLLITGSVYAVLMIALGAVTFKEKQDRFFLYI